MRPSAHFLIRLAAVLTALLPAGCGYFTGHWPTLKEDPIPDTSAEVQDAAPSDAAAPERPAPPAEHQPPASVEEAVSRLTDYQTRFNALQTRANDQLQAINPAPKTPDDWGVAQLNASRLLRSENNLRTLLDDIKTDARALASPQAQDYTALADSISELLSGLTPRRLALEQQLAAHVPEEAPAASAPALPQGRPALTIAADAKAAAYSQAVTTLVEKAQAINATSVYHIVAAPGDTAAARVDNVRSLLTAAGIPAARIRQSTDPTADVGSLRIYVQEP